MKKFFPCPYCTRQGLPSVEQGERGDFGIQIGPDYPCGGCDGTGFIEVGSEKHFDVKLTSTGAALFKIFGEALDEMPEKQHKLFWDSIKFDAIKETWLKLNKQTEANVPEQEIE